MEILDLRIIVLEKVVEKLSRFGIDQNSVVHEFFYIYYAEMNREFALSCSPNIFLLFSIIFSEKQHGIRALLFLRAYVETRENQ